MKNFNVAYVPNGSAHPYPSKDLNEMTLEEIVTKHIRTCGKANGNVSICSQCKSPCQEGKRAIQLLANKVYNDPPIPLYGGKTLIERAREENMKRREQKENTNMAALAQALEEAKQKALEKDGLVETKRKAYVRRDGWWEESLASGDQVKWLIDNMKMSKTQAKKKIYQYKYMHGLTGQPKIEEPVVTPAEDVKIEIPDTKLVSTDVELKLEALLKKQEEYKSEMIKYQNLYNEAQKKYEEIKKKTDILCSAMDILND